MSNWTLKRALSELASKFRRSDSAESSSSYLADDEGEDEGLADAYVSGEYAQEIEGDEGTPVSPLALMSDASPEAWLGQFLLILKVPARGFGTIETASRDKTLRQGLETIHRKAAESSPVRLLEPGYAQQLKAQDWSAWWKGEEALGDYCYTALALSLLGDTAYAADLAAMYRQDANSRIQKDAHYVLCHLLGKPWPGHNVTEQELRRLVVRSQ